MANRKIKNLLVLPTLFPKSEDDFSGIFVWDYVSCVKQYFKVSILFLKISGAKKGLQVEEVNGISIYRYYAVSSNSVLKNFKILCYLWLFFKGTQIAKKIKFDCIHAHGTVLKGSLGLFLSRKHKVPVYVTEHTGPFSKLTSNFLNKRITKYVLQNVTALLTVSDDLKQQVLSSGIYPKKIFVTYNPVDTDLFQPGSLSQRAGLKNIIFASRLEKYKGGLRTVNAFINIRKEFPDWKLTIIGDGPEAKPIRALIAKDQLEKVIVLKGSLSKSAIASEFKEASFFVCPSEHETFGLTLAEAMSAGLPVIAGNKTAPKEFIDETCGLLASPDDENEISKALSQMMNTFADYDSNLIRQRIIDRFGFEVFGKRLLKIYSDND